MSTVYFDDVSVRIPAWVLDRTSFRRWLHSDDFPEKGRICYLAGEVWVDMSTEQVFSHNQLKNEVSFVLTGLAKAEKLGKWFPDGILIGSAEVDFTSGPDGCFVSQESLKTGRVRLIPGAKTGYVELEGSPDMVLEVVSDSSEKKDTVLLRDLYWQAEIQEYWLIDARGERFRFEILRHAPKGYTATKRQGGWIKSTVFGKSFQLSRGVDALDNPEYTLAVR